MKLLYYLLICVTSMLFLSVLACLGASFLPVDGIVLGNTTSAGTTLFYKIVPNEDIRSDIYLPALTTIALFSFILTIRVRKKIKNTVN